MITKPISSERTQKNWMLNFSYFMDVTFGRYIMTTRRRQERRLKSEFAFFQSLYRLFLPTYFVNCRRTLLKLNFKGPYSSSEREIKFRRCLFTSSMKREIRHFRVAVVQKRERNTQKSVMHLRSCCFVY